MTRNLFSREYLDYHMYKSIPVAEKFKKHKTLSFRALKSSRFYLLSVSWTGNELAGDDVESCENSQLTKISDISFNFVLVSVEILLK